MERMEQRLEQAKTQPREMEKLLLDYMPFIKKQVSRLSGPAVEEEDLLSVAMVTFVSCVRVYEVERGNFLSFAAFCIRNRLIDELRRGQRHSSALLALQAGGADAPEGAVPEAAASLEEYGREQERLALAEEIDAYTQELDRYGVSFAELPAISPKQRRAREQCVAAARRLVMPDLREELLRGGRVPQARLAREMGLSPKTIEKHRKYIVSVAVLLLGDFPGIRSFLPRERTVSGETGGTGA